MRIFKARPQAELEITLLGLELLRLRGREELLWICFRIQRLLALIWTMSGAISLPRIIFLLRCPGSLGV